MVMSAVRASSGVLTGRGNASRTGRGPSAVLADISNPYRSTPVIAADEISRALENAVQYRTRASAWSAFMCATTPAADGPRFIVAPPPAADGPSGSGSAACHSAVGTHDMRP